MRRRKQTMKSVMASTVRVRALTREVNALARILDALDIRTLERVIRESGELSPLSEKAAMRMRVVIHDLDTNRTPGRKVCALLQLKK